MKSEAIVDTEHGAAYLKRLCRHFAHKIPASIDGGQGRLEFPLGICTIEVDNRGMHIRLMAIYASDLERGERVITVRMANKDKPVIEWN